MEPIVCTPDEGYDCDGNCLGADTNMNGWFVTSTKRGCTDIMACNYDALACFEDNDQCVYAEEDYDCDGNCINDADMDGICDEFEVPGCTDARLATTTRLPPMTTNLLRVRRR